MLDCVSDTAEQRQAETESWRVVAWAQAHAVIADDDVDVLVDEHADGDRDGAFGCYVDPDAQPDAHGLPALIETELEQLGRAANGPRTGDARVSHS